MAHDSSRQQAMVTYVPVATVVNGEQLMPLVLVHERTLAVWVIVGPAADAALGQPTCRPLRPTRPQMPRRTLRGSGCSRRVC